MAAFRFRSSILQKLRRSLGIELRHIFGICFEEDDIVGMTVVSAMMAAVRRKQNGRP